MIYILLIPIGLAVLLFVSAYEGVFGLSLDAKVRVSDSFSVVCTTILALALQYILIRRNTTERDRRDVAIDASTAVLSSVQDLRQWISDAVTGVNPTAEQTQKVVYGFECCVDAILMLELTLEGLPDPLSKDLCAEITKALLTCKRQVTGEDFPKRMMTYADVELLSTFRRDIARRIAPLRRTSFQNSGNASAIWRQLKNLYNDDSWYK